MKGLYHSYRRECRMKVLMVLGLVLLGGCAPSIKRMGYTLDPSMTPQNGNVEFTRESRDLTGFNKIGSISIYDNGFSTNCSETKVLLLLEQEANRIGATRVNLYNMQDPSIFGSSCFQTNADFYAPDTANGIASQNSDENMPMASQAVPLDNKDSDYDYDSIGHNGLEILLGFDIGSVLSGGQKSLALEGIVPSPDGVNCVGYPIYLTKWWNWIGVTGGYSYALASAIKQSYEPLGLYDQHIIRAGAALAPIRYQSRRNLHRLLIGAGLNYDFLTFNSENVIQLSGTATGFGYYLNGGYSMLHLGGLSMGLDLSYESKNPKMTGALRALNANEFQVLMRLGYFWHW